VAQNFLILGSSARETIFGNEGGRLYLHQLCGVPCGLNDQDDGPQSTRGMFTLSIPGASITSLDWFATFLIGRRIQRILRAPLDRQG